MLTSTLKAKWIINPKTVFWKKCGQNGFDLFLKILQDLTTFPKFAS